MAHHKLTIHDFKQHYILYNSVILSYGTFTALQLFILSSQSLVTLEKEDLSYVLIIISIFAGSHVNIITHIHGYY